MVEKIYLVDQYLKELDANVISVNGQLVELDKTIFYPGGGGQPCDTGEIRINDIDYKVVEVRKTNDSIIHILDKAPSAKKNDIAICRIDWDKRYAYMRHHTALHVIGGVLENGHSNGKITGGQIYSTRAHLDFDLTSLNRELALKILEEAQRVIDGNKSVRAKILAKDEALKIPNLIRTDPGRDIFKNLEEIRVIEIDGFDMQLDGGLHVSNTKEIGKLSLARFENKGAHRKRVEIELI